MENLELMQLIHSVLAALVALCYLYQIVYLVAPFFLKSKPRCKAVPQRFAILIAARNEEAVLPYLLSSIRAQDYPAELTQVYVVADNCTDGTARVAAEGGARVYERFNRTEIGKGYALNHLLGCIRQEDALDEYDAFLVFDADNLLAPDYLSEMNRSFSDGYEVLCGYRNSKNFAANWVSAGYAVWYLHDAVHLNQSRMLLHTSCAVSGTGFGFTRETLEKCGGWNFFTLTEDIEFNVYCVTHGIRIGYCPDAMLYDEQPTSFRQSWRQRTRWTQGGVQIAFKYGRDLLQGMFRRPGSRFACFETLTISLWGYCCSALIMAFGLFLTFLTGRGSGLLMALLSSAASCYASMLLVGLLAVASEWRRINASASGKIGAVLAFPLFILTFIPIGFTALFRKYQWQPIYHTCAVPVSTMAPCPARKGRLRLRSSWLNS